MISNIICRSVPQNVDAWVKKEDLLRTFWLVTAAISSLESRSALHTSDFPLFLPPFKEVLRGTKFSSVDEANSTESSVQIFFFVLFWWENVFKRWSRKQFFFEAKFEWILSMEHTTKIISVCTLTTRGLVWFYNILTLLGYLIPNPLYTYIWDIHDLVWLGFMAYQPL